MGSFNANGSTTTKFWWRKYFKKFTKSTLDSNRTNNLPMIGEKKKNTN